MYMLNLPFLASYNSTLNPRLARKQEDKAPTYKKVFYVIINLHYLLQDGTEGARVKDIYGFL